MPSAGDDMDWDEPKGEPIDSEAVFRFLRRRRRIMLLTGLALSPLLAILPLETASVYESAATVVVQLPPEVTEFGADFMPESAGRFSPLARAAAIVNSDRVLGPVIDRIGASTPDPPGLFQRALDTLGLDSRAEPLPADVERELRIEQLRKSILLTFQGGNAILEIAARSGTPETSAWLANSIADSFVAYERDERRAASSAAIRWLSEKAIDLRGTIRSKELALASLREDLSGAPVDAEASAEISRESAEGRLSLQAVERRIAQLPRGPASQGSRSDQELAALQEHAAAKADLEDARLVYTETHPEVRRRRERVEALLAELPEGSESERMTTLELQELRELEAQRGRLRARIAASEAQQRRRTQSARDVADQVADYGRVERALEVERDMLATVLRRSNETLVAAANTTPLARVLDYAVTPVSPAGSPQAKTLALALGVVFILAIGAGVAAEVLDSTIYDGEVVAADVGVPLLGIIPKAKFGAHGIADPRSLVGESYRHLRTTLSFVASRRSRPSDLLGAAPGVGPDSSGAQTLLVSSAVAGEGKTTTAVNLAASFARSGRTTLLIDSDLRRPKVAEVLGIPKAPGLADLLAGKLEIEDAIQQIPDVGFDVIQSGEATEGTFDLLGPQKVEVILSKLAAQYDLVILDAPVLLSVSDTLALAASVDGVLFVSKPGSVNRKAFPKIAEELRQAEAHVLGVVFTQVDARDGYAYPTYLQSPYSGRLTS